MSSCVRVCCFMSGTGLWVRWERDKRACGCAVVWCTGVGISQDGKLV